MTTKIWIGGGNNLAGNPRDWTPEGRPAASDQPFIPGGTINVFGTALSGKVTVGGVTGSPAPTGPITINLMHTNGASYYANEPGQSITFNAYDANFTLQDGLDDFAFGVSTTINLAGRYDLYNTDVAAGSSESIKLAPHTIWTGAITVDARGNHDFGGNVTVTGAPGSAFHNTTSAIGNATTTIDTDVVGIGTISVGVVQSLGAHPTALEFMHGVSSGQTITMVTKSGNIVPNYNVTLEIDQPRAFAATVDFAGGQIDLLGLAQADSYSFANGVLAIYRGNAIIDRLHLNDQTPSGFDVEKTTTGVNVIGIDGINAGAVALTGAVLPQHTTVS